MGKRAAVLVAVLVITVSGCGAEPTRPDPAGSIEAAIGYRPERMAELRAARDEAIRTCMRAAGFDWQPRPEDPMARTSPHGLFGLETPAAYRNFRLSHGYGASEHLYANKLASERFVAGNPQDRYVASLPTARRARYAKALGGKGTGCTGAGGRAVGGLEPDEGGPLGEAYGVALAEMSESADYRAFEQAVVACMKDDGEEFADLEAVYRHYIGRLAKLTNAKVGTDPEGRPTWEFGADGNGAELRVRKKDLDALGRDERRTAKAEVACRDEHGEEEDRLLARYSEPVIGKHQALIDRFRQLMNQSER